MTYTQVVNRLGEKLRDEEAWPVSGSASSEQLYLTYIAALTVLREVPLSRMATVDSSAMSINRSIGKLDMYDLPSDVMYIRLDGGISHFLFDDTPYYPFQAMPYDSIRELAGLSLHGCNILFAIDMSSRSLFVKGAGEVKVNYYAMPSLPESGTPDYPLTSQPDIERALSIVASHVSGETIRDQAASVFQSLLVDLYGEPRVAED